MIVELCSKILEKKGYQTLKAFSAKDALNTLSSEKIDLIIADIRMPEMDGIELLETVDKNWPGLPFIFITGFATLETALEALKRGASGLIMKPFTSAEMEDAVEKVLTLDMLRKENIKLQSLISLFETTREIVSKPNISEAVCFLVEELKEQLKADKVEIVAIPEETFLYENIESKTTNWCSKESLKLAKVRSEAGHPAIFGIDVEDAPETIKEIMQKDNISQVLCYGIRREGKTIGVINVMREKGEEKFSSTEQNAFGILCQQFETNYVCRVYHLELERAYEDLIESFMLALEARDAYTGGHGTSVSNYALLIADEMKIGVVEKEVLLKAAKLHDIGKVGIPDDILLKPDKLTGEEFNRIKLHPIIGFEILAKNQRLLEVANITLCHHEWYSGKGYPNGLKGEDIPLLARIICVADAFHALVSDRPYRKAFSKEEALKIIESETPLKYDPKIVQILKSKIIIDAANLPV